MSTHSRSNDNATVSTNRSTGRAWSPDLPPRGSAKLVDEAWDRQKGGELAPGFEIFPNCPGSLEEPGVHDTSCGHEPLGQRSGRWNSESERFANRASRATHCPKWLSSVAEPSDDGTNWPTVVRARKRLRGIAMSREYHCTIKFGRLLLDPLLEAEWFCLLASKR